MTTVDQDAIASHESEIRILADLLDLLNLKAVETVEWGSIYAPLYDAAIATRSRLVHALAASDALVGAEYCDECGEYVDTIVRVEHSPDTMLISSDSGYYPEQFTIGDVYLRPPGSTAYGDLALVELARRAHGVSA